MRGTCYDCGEIKLLGPFDQCRECYAVMIGTDIEESFDTYKAEDVIKEAR